MASVFLSYDHEDRARASPIAAALEEAGHSVWWDRHIHGGAEYNSEIETAVDQADAVVVLWSEHSIRSAWVRDEAAEGRDQRKLVPAVIDPVKPPMGFRQYQTIDLSRRKKGPQRFDELLQAINDRSSVQGSSPISAISRRPRPPGKWLVTAVTVVLILGAGGILLRPVNGPSSVPVVAVAGVGGSADSQILARDLLVKLGNLRSAKIEAVRLTEADAGAAEQATFVFEVAPGGDPNTSGNLALLTGKDHSVLWSKDFDVEGSNRTGLEQGMAYTAGQVLDCAVQATTASVRLDEQTLKLFLNGCALYAERYFSDSNSVVPIFERVVGSAPEFQPAWAKLLLAEAQTTRAQMLYYGRLVPGHLPEHIHTVSILSPRLPELYVAKTALLPLGALDERFRLLDQAVGLGGDDPNTYWARSFHQVDIGRNSDAAEDARRAAELDPLSPGFESNLIQTLAYTGQIAAADQELHHAEQLWPGTPAIEDARFRITSRFGDAREALQMLHSAGFRQMYPTSEMESYLLARLDPSESNIRRAIEAAQNPQLPEPRRIVQTIQLLGDFGRENELYNMLMGFTRAQLMTAAPVLFRPSLRKARKDQRFMIISARAGLIDYWRKSGKWPDFCFDSDLPYDCKKEAAKYH